tara:strand:- start:1215 stop:3815 length:2601 start_codon:yes stop_codon:yes gene_type:complete
MNDLRKESLHYINLSDYKIFDYSIPEIFVNFIIEKEKVKVISEYKFIKENQSSDSLKLKGDQIEIVKIILDNEILSKDRYEFKNNELTISSINKRNFILKIESFINPKTNTSLIGMYESNEIITTQCEAEGFRRICFHPDRPDILSKYKIRIEADKNKYPILLSNGNLIKKNLLDNNRQEVFWEDPFPKPSYLFALVAGKLVCTKEIYYTSSNKKIDIHIYVEKGDEEFVQHAIQSLKRAMRWDEEKYNLEYDLNLFNIVAIRHFNMGAMENKGLNIFNSKLVLANSETSTDEELERIEGVVAHEYFHNWTGNRITCRDWFQLSLKEGLTVFRDQQFTSDMHNHAIKRIEDVKFLRNTQFREDSGPTSHPVKPEKYLEIDNFYTTTIYEKGSEIIRMVQTITNKERFKKGFASFIYKYDGQAATIDDFIDTIFEEVDGLDTEKFKLWYKQNGTPQLTFKRDWNKHTKTLKISISQSNSKNNPINKLPLIIPINLAVFTDKNKYKKFNFVLTKNNDQITLNNINTDLDKPITSYLRSFSAPVKWETDLNLEEELFILENEKDYFSIYDSAYRIHELIIFKRVKGDPLLSVEDKLIKIYKSLLKSKDYNLALLSEILNIPTFTQIESTSNFIDPLNIYKAIDEINKKFSRKLKNELIYKFDSIENSLYQLWPKGKDDRKLINVIWKLLLFCDDSIIRKRVLKFVKSTNMTLSKAALNVFQEFDCEEREEASKIFFNRWASNKVVLDNWFYFSASSESKNSIEKIENLFNHELFDKKSPNTLRSILNGFVSNNRTFHSKDGRGYNYIAEKIIKYDKYNPIIISRFLKIFSRWNLYNEPYRSLMLNSIYKIDKIELSNNSREVINLILNK